MCGFLFPNMSEQEFMKREYATALCCVHLCANRRGGNFSPLAVNHPTATQFCTLGLLRLQYGGVHGCVCFCDEFTEKEISLEIGVVNNDVRRKIHEIMKRNLFMHRLL
jgi:hypothetical protein